MPELFSKQNNPMSNNSNQNFWEIKKLSEMNIQEWEAICDGCAKCCVYKLEDIDTGEFLYTNVACHLLDTQSCKCTNYNNRFELEPGCVKLTPQNVYELKWLPETCAYRLLAEGKPLPDWHHLICGNIELVHELGFSIRNRVIKQINVDMRNLEDYIVDWLR